MNQVKRIFVVYNQSKEIITFDASLSLDLIMVECLEAFNLSHMLEEYCLMLSNGNCLVKHEKHIKEDDILILIERYQANFYLKSNQNFERIETNVTATTSTRKHLQLENNNSQILDISYSKHDKEDYFHEYNDESLYFEDENFYDEDSPDYYDEIRKASSYRTSPSESQETDGQLSDGEINYNDQREGSIEEDNFCPANNEEINLQDFFSQLYPSRESLSQKINNWASEFKFNASFQTRARELLKEDCWVSVLEC